MKRRRIDKKRVLQGGVLVLVGLGAAWLGLCYAAPDAVLTMGQRARMARAGLESDRVRIDDHRIRYFRGGQGPVVLVFHGFADRADSWIPFARRLMPNHRFVFPELAGFGGSTRRADADYGFEAQTERMEAFIEELGLERFHLVGESMGGTIAAMYAGRHPERVESLLLLAPAGIRSPQRSAYFEALERGDNPLVVRDAEDYRTLLRYSFHEPPDLIPWYVPEAPLRSAIIDRLADDADFYERVLRELADGGLYPLDDVLPRVEVPTRVLWGAEDRIVHPSSLRVVRDVLPQAETDELAQCGHALHLECPARVLEQLREQTGAG